jgi:RNA polymerase sigma-70 factor, ECF subfamily
MTHSAPISKPQPVARTVSHLETLATDLRRGQEGALEALIANTEKACFHLALSILKDGDLAKDALQDAYFHVYQKIGQLREMVAFKAWLFRIVTHACHDILRKRKNEFETDLSERDDLLADVSITEPTDPSEVVPKQEVLRATFRDLPEIDRQAIALREVCSLSYEEMSRVLNIPIGTVRSRLAKARKRFIQAYRKEQKS